MRKALQRTFNISDTGSQELMKASVWLGLYYLAALAPVVLLVYVADNMISQAAGLTDNVSLIACTAGALMFAALIYVAYRRSYKSKYYSSCDEDQRMRMSLAEKIRRLPMSYLGKRDVADFTSTVMDDVKTVEGVLATSLAEFLASVMFALVTLVILACYNWRMTLVLAAALPLAALAMALGRLVSEGQNKRNRARRVDLSESLQEYLENMQALRSSPRMGDYQKRLGEKAQKLVPGLVGYELLAGLGLSLGENFLRAGLGFVMVFGAAQLSAGEVSLAGFLLFLLVSVRLYEPLCVAVEKLGALIHALVSAGRIREILDHPVQEGASDVAFDGFDIEFDHVSFAYDTREVIHDVSFSVPQGSVTALVGPSGCGKSTLCRLAARFWDVNSGSVRVGGVDVREVDPETLMRHFSFVFQDVVLFNDSILNNIRIGRMDATDEEVREAARLACCDEFVQALPQGYDTVIGENGKTLSGGQRQRLSIARSILKDAPIILLDESTASIDPENETRIQQALGRLVKGKTVLIIAHRLRSIADCDQIVVIKDGSVREVGAHEELMGLHGLYAHLFELQSGRAWAPSAGGSLADAPPAPGTQPSSCGA